MERPTISDDEVEAEHALDVFRQQIRDDSLRHLLIPDPPAQNEGPGVVTHPHLWPADPQTIDLVAAITGREIDPRANPAMLRSTLHRWAHNGPAPTPEQITAFAACGWAARMHQPGPHPTSGNGRPTRHCAGTRPS